MIPIHRPKISSTQDTVHNSRQPHANLGRVGHLHPVWARTIHRVHSSRAAENHPESIFTIAHAFSSTEQSQQWRDDECRDRQTRSDEDHASSPRHRISWKRPGQPIDTGVQGAVSRPASGCAHYILGRTIGSGATSSRYQVLRGTVPSPSISGPSPDRPLNRYPKTPKQPRSSEENYRDRSGMFSFNLDGLRSIRARLAVTRCFQAPSPRGLHQLHRQIYCDRHSDPRCQRRPQRPLHRAGTITTSNDSSIVLARGTQTENVYWRSTGDVTLGASSTARGTFLANTGASVESRAKLIGRLYSCAGSLTVTRATISSPS